MSSALAQSSEVIVAGTSAFKKMEIDSRKRNRGPHPTLIEGLDPEGLHVVAYQMIHNEVEWRCQWLCKLEDREDPVRVWMDNGFDSFADNTHTVVHDYPGFNTEPPTEQ